MDHASHQGGTPARTMSHRPDPDTEDAGHAQRDMYHGAQPSRNRRPLPALEDHFARRSDIHHDQMSPLDPSNARYPTVWSGNHDQRNISHPASAPATDMRSSSTGSVNSGRRALPTPPKAPGGARPARALPTPPRVSLVEPSSATAIPPNQSLRAEALRQARPGKEQPAAIPRISDMRGQEADLSRSSSHAHSLQTSRSSASFEQQSGVSSTTHLTSFPATSFDHGSVEKYHQAGRYTDLGSAPPVSGIAGMHIDSSTSASDLTTQNASRSHETSRGEPRFDDWSFGSSTYGESSRSAQPAVPSHATGGNSYGDADDRRRSSELSPSWAEQSQQPSHWVERKLRIHQGREEGIIEDDMEAYDPGYSDDEWEGEAEEMNEIRFFQPALLSESALQLRDRVERRRHLKAGIAWVGSFTGRDIVTTIQSFLPTYTRESPSDRRYAIIMAQSLQKQLWFVEVDWDIKPLRDSPEDVFRFMGDMDGGGTGEALAGELPQGVMTMATRCYASSCSGDDRCYAPRCPFRTSPASFLQVASVEAPTSTPSPMPQPEGEWTAELDPFIERQLSEQQRTRQTILRQAIQSEAQYEADLTAMERLYIDGLRHHDVIRPARRREEFISAVFGNAMDLRDAARRVMEHFSIRKREQAPLVTTIGDIFLESAADFRLMYPEYTGNLPNAELVLKKELEENADFRLFSEKVVREHDRRYEIKHLITRPSAHLQKYPAVLEALLGATDPDSPDLDFLAEALATIRNLSALSQLRLFQASRGRGPASKLMWNDVVTEEQMNAMGKKEQKRQMQIWEVIQGEMGYIADLETMEQVFVDGLRLADVPIIERSRLEIFLDDAFHNYRSILDIHSSLLEDLFARQLEQHPKFGMISDLIFNAALNWQEAYMEYVTHYPIAKAKVQEEQNRNPQFAAFLETCLRNPLVNRQDIYHFINRPIPRLLRYNLLLADILKTTQETEPPDHPDIETIPQVTELLHQLGKATEKGLAVNEAKVELWQLQHTLDGGKFGSRAVKDLDLTNSMRELIHKGRVYRQTEGTISGGWVELVVFLFDNYFVLAKPEKLKHRRADRRVRYFINRRPIPLELLTPGNFGDAPRARNTGKLFNVGSSHLQEGDGSDQADTRIWPFTISFIGQGQLGGQYTLWTDSWLARSEWQEKLQHAKVLRAEVNDAGKVFEMTPLSIDTFFVPNNYAVPRADGDNPFTGRVTCSASFETIDGRLLVAVGCEEGAWIGFRNDPKSLRKVLHVKAVTNIAILEEFGIFLILQDKTLLAYHLEALVPTAASPQLKTTPQRLSTSKDIEFFCVGQLSGRTLVVYMRRKGPLSFFRVLEPISGRIAEDVRQRRPFGALLGQRTEWFRIYKEFLIGTDGHHVQFLKHKLAVVCTKGFEIMDLTDLKGGSLPVFDPHKVRDFPLLADLQKKCETAKPLGMFRSTETEFLLCYDAFGIYVDRHGEPNRDTRPIEWEGRPESVAFHPPYLLLISPPFIEIRHIDDARLLQIHTGSDIRMTWDGTGGQARPFIDNPGPKGYGDETSSQEPRIHICQRPEDRRSRGSQGIGQHVFELTPTLALNNPLLNPVHTLDSNYFPPAPPLSQRASSIITTTSDYYQQYGYSASISEREPSWYGP